MQRDNSVQTLEKAVKDIKKGIIAPCYLIYGDEEYLIRDAFDRLVDQILPKADRSLNLFCIEGGQENVAILCQSLLTAPLIPGRKIVAVKNTILFQSKKNLPALVQKIRDHLEGNLPQASGYFLQFLNLAGWKLADLRDGGWEKITDQQWQKAVEGDRGEDREKWLPRIIDHCLQSGMESSGSKDDSGGLGGIVAAGLPEGNHLVLTAQVVDKRKQLFKQIEEVGCILHFPHLKGEARQKSTLIEMTQDMLKKKGKRLTPEAWQVLGRKTGFDFRESMAALEKLILYSADKPIIEASDVEEVTGKTKEDTVFEFTSAVVMRNLAQALVIMTELLEQGIHHLVIMKMLTRELRLLLYARLLVTSGKLDSFRANMDFSRFQTSVHPAIKALGGKDKEGPGLLASQHPYVAFKLLKNSENFSTDDLLRYLEYLADMDVALRSTGRDPKMMLERFITEVCFKKTF